MKRARQACALIVGLLSCLATARGQYPFSDPNRVQSMSGQFVVTSVDSDVPVVRDRELAANTNLVRLNPAVLAVAAERFKVSLWQQLGILSSSPWTGRIFLDLHQARRVDETVTIASSALLNRWNYRVELPDRLSKTRYARALCAVLLLELANRTAPADGHSAELPNWLVDGLAQQLLAIAGDQLVLSMPVRKSGDVAVNRVNRFERGLDAFADARPILQSLPVLTFDQLSWPTEAQLAGADGGAYYASAQLFQSELLGLKSGRDKMRALLGELPGHFNWQTAFFHAFGGDFQRPLDVEKWWALRVVNFNDRAPGPRWTTDVSLARMNELLSVPVDYRGNSNALPAHAEISLQDALRNLDPAQQEMVLRTKVRDLALEEFRLAPPFGALADRYRVALEGFLGDSLRPANRSVPIKHGVSPDRRAQLAETVKQLDALDIVFRRAASQSVVNLSGARRPGGP